MSDTLLTLHDVRFGYDRNALFLGPVELGIQAGQCWAIVGPNGAGKSTLLRLMAGLLQPTSGQIRLDTRPLTEWPPSRRAQYIAFLPQHVPTDLDLTAQEVVLLGRFPHRSLGLFESAADHRVAERVMAITATLPFARRSLRTLSGGEAQRVHLAAALAQTPRLLLLDEPTASLDLRHQLSMLQLLREQVDHQSLAVVLVTHDLNMAAQFATHVLVLHAGRVVAQGAPGDVLLPRILDPVYGVQLTVFSGADALQQTWLAPLLVKGEPRT